MRETRRRSIDVVVKKKREQLQRKSPSSGNKYGKHCIISLLLLHTIIIKPVYNTRFIESALNPDERRIRLRDRPYVLCGVS